MAHKHFDVVEDSLLLAVQILYNDYILNLS